MKVGMRISLAFAAIFVLMVIISANTFLLSGKVVNQNDDLQKASTQGILALRDENEYIGAIVEIHRFLTDANEAYTMVWEDKMNENINQEELLLSTVVLYMQADVEKFIDDTTKQEVGNRR